MLLQAQHISVFYIFFYVTSHMVAKKKQNLLLVLDEYGIVWIGKDPLKKCMSRCSILLILVAFYKKEDTLVWERCKIVWTGSVVPLPHHHLSVHHRRTFATA